ncbi:MAG: Holliday junction branch migration protein RuvA [Rhodobacteraceae bacterium]|uniref:Holliday junction branch migration protein RuvA n=1 Tax=Stappia TaxID=152161 RepID=UPI000C4FF477|nr:Holliday junction branch migration protein RuvA [Stappia stellulata]MBB99848.1 Holliday junction branch migration protein RuvA [Paracoccaceae bacterium]MCA1243736.1 Holliday junction branch migration protein RuvA [Stappia stellulata]
MIGKLKGRVDEIGDDHLILDVGGVGYLVYCPARVLQGLPSPGEAAALHIETIVREDMIRLYGFSSRAEQAWFQLLMTVQGVGAKVALAALGVLSASEIANAIALGDTAAITRTPGIGKRVAERIVTELKSKAPAYASVDAGTLSVSQQASSGAPSSVGDAVSALVNLGYPSAQASAAVSKAVKSAGEGADTATLIRLGLKELSA